MITPAYSVSSRDSFTRPRLASLAAAFLLLGSGFFFTGCVADGRYGYASAYPTSYYGGYGYEPSYYGGYGYGGGYYSGGFLIRGRSHRHHYGRHHYVGQRRYRHHGAGFRGGYRGGHGRGRHHRGR